MFQESGDLFISTPSYSPIPAAQTLRQNVMNYLERERPNSSYSPISPPLSPCRNVQMERPFQFEDGPHCSTSNNISNKRRGNELMYSYVKKSVKGPQRKIIRIQIFDTKEFDGSKLCECKADVCAQHIVENVFSDDLYRCTKDLISKIQYS